MILSDDGRLVIAKATSEGYEEVASASVLEGRCWTVPVLLDGCVYARNAAGKLVAVQLPQMISICNKRRWLDDLWNGQRPPRGSK